MNHQIEPGMLVDTEYAELRRLVDVYATEQYDLLTILGDGGVGKSAIVSQTMPQRHGSQGWGLIKGKHSPLDLYARLYRYRLVPVVLDGLLKYSDNTAILKAACETTLVKCVEWESTHAAFRGEHEMLPKSFDSISKVCVIANDIGRLTRDMQALQTRGVCILFRSTALEVHREVARGGWFDDEQVFTFIGQNLHLVMRPNMQSYLTTRAHMGAGLDWRDLTVSALQVSGDDKLMLVARLPPKGKFARLPRRGGRRRSIIDSPRACSPRCTLLRGEGIRRVSPAAET